MSARNAEADLAALAYLVSGVLFILALRGLSSPATTSRTGNRNGMIGMAIAVATTLWVAGVTDRADLGHDRGAASPSAAASARSSRGASP